MEQIPTKTLQFCVYKITNDISGKSYIGKTKDLKIRWRDHLRKSKNKNVNNKFPNALKKYPENTWDVSILYETDDENHCYEVEALLVNEYDTFHSGYNSCSGGIGGGAGKNNPMFGKKGKNNPNFGKKYPRSQEQKDARSGENSHLFGKTGENSPNFGNRWNMSQEQKDARSGENNPMFGIMPWNHHNCKLKGLEINWYYLDKVYDVRIQNPSYYGAGRIYKILVKNYPDIKNSKSSFQNMFRWIEKNGNPIQNKDWLEFKTNYLQPNI